MTYVYLKGFIYTYIPFKYAYMAIYTLPHSLNCIYIYIYIYTYICMQCKTLNHCVQATGAVGSCSEHGITIQQCPPEAAIGFY